MVIKGVINVVMWYFSIYGTVPRYGAIRYGGSIVWYYRVVLYGTRARYCTVLVGSDGPFAFPISIISIHFSGDPSTIPSHWYGMVWYGMVQSWAMLVPRFSVLSHAIGLGLD